MGLRTLIEERVSQFFEDNPDKTYDSSSKKFLFYAISMLLKPFSLDYEQIVAGITDDTGDLGIDALYVFNSGELLEEESDLDGINADAQVELKFVQVTREDGFGETSLLKTKNGVEAVFDYSRSLTGNEALRRQGDLARKAVKRWALKNNTNPLRVNVYYICFGDTNRINKGVSDNAEKLKDAIRRNCLAEVRVHFTGAKEIFALGSQEAYSSDLHCNNIIEYVDKQKNPDLLGWVCIVEADSLLQLLSNEQSQLDARNFQYNVRDYYGPVKRVNRNMAMTLKSEERRNFWCLNNGVTIVCRKGNKLDRDITLKDFQVVNGCQTVHVLNEFRDILKNDKTCLVVVKIIQTSDENVEANIIDATNSQTVVQGTALHANEPVQKAIEEHFLRYDQHPLYYERRTNFYRRRSKAAARIVPVMRLFQVMYSVFWKKPGQSRNSPSSTFEANYDQVFDPDYDYDSYLIAYLLYLRLYSINRANMRKGGHGQVEEDVMDYGMLHLTRTVFAFIRNGDAKLDLKNKKSEFQTLKGKLFAALDDSPKLEEMYSRSVTIVESAMASYRAVHADAVGSNILRSDDFDENYLTRTIRSNLRRV